MAPETAGSAGQDRITTTAAGIPYEDTDCTADEAVEAVKAVRTTAATYPTARPCAVEGCGEAEFRGGKCTEHCDPPSAVTGIHKDPATGGSA